MTKQQIRIETRPVSIFSRWSQRKTHEKITHATEVHQTDGGSMSGCVEAPGQMNWN